MTWQEDAEVVHDDKGFSEERCVRCGWVMGRPALNCQNDDTPHVFPSSARLTAALEAVERERDGEKQRAWHIERDALAFKDRAEAAEQRIAELEAENTELRSAKILRKAEQRIAELEATLRTIGASGYDCAHPAIARAVLGEKP